ncbi:carboxyltransferase domain-containing protein [Hirsutella rhossiliensis]|uniref:Carboxyltransferase domain-containing protein n=1 Tax=Hirsutella rhossiliensis TaxID=111463 RepID=A0A9P8N430_9HYPO|nr:carboxyltransferase domain-containing protein [Hirsutella rhossiliensis]KAH0965459.1 carboxyltransferase domain-containing protein [Hirsutella rhossiliensis]
MGKESPRRLLIANRGEIANRILKAARRLDFHIVSIYTSTDVSSPHVTEADVSLPVSSYTDIEEIVGLIKQNRVQYVIPGYGFLSENQEFAVAIRDAGAVFVGPEPEHISTFGIQGRARDLAASIGAMLKATAGGGGMGFHICENESELRSSFASVARIGKELFEASELLGRAIKYQSAGTLEYLVDDTTASFFCLEMNSRLQVEHGITEMRFGIDLVELLLQQAESPMKLDPLKKIIPTDFAIEARVYAEDPLKNHMPSPGQLQQLEFGGGPGVRVGTWVRTGTIMSLAYDPLLAKVMAHGRTRAVAISALTQTLAVTKLQGIVTNADLLRKILESSAFSQGRTTTNFLKSFEYTPCVMEIVSPGSYTTIHDFPGRRGVGFGNDPSCELLEITYSGPKIKFHQKAIVAMAGAVADAQIDESPVPMYTRLDVPAGALLSVGALSGGCRTHLAVRGGFPGIPLYLNAKSTNPVVEIGGLQGRQLVAGDILEMNKAGMFEAFELQAPRIPVWDSNIVCCLSGPHDSPDIMTPEDVESIYSSEWTVSHQASRIGVRLHGSQPYWARQTGGEGGSHPSNYLDYPYPIGALNWTGDSCVIFSADAPSLGGFTTSHLIPRAELFKVGQMKPGDKFLFTPMTIQSATELGRRLKEFIEAISSLALGNSEPVEPLPLSPPSGLGLKTGSTAIICRLGDVTMRQAGDSYISVEFLQSLQLEVRCRVQAVGEAIDRAGIRDVCLITPIGCSLLVEYDCFPIPQSGLVDIIKRVLVDERGSGSGAKKLSSRHIRLPMVFDDEVNKICVERYMATQRPYAAYLPDPVEFIARSNGLDSKQEILEQVLSTRILVVGVGFWSGTPIGIPLDPRARLMVPKSSPSRTVSPAGGLGIGGCFFCCDPVDSPGGYVNIGRTLPGWDKFCVNKDVGDRPWLFDNFDQLSFYTVDEDEFEHIHSRCQAGKYELSTTQTEFDVGEYSEFCESVAEEAAAFEARQQAATAIEVGKCVAASASRGRRWQAEQKVEEKDALPPLDDVDETLEIQTSMHASVYKIHVQNGDAIEAGDVLFTLEAMKMEVNVAASTAQAGLAIESIVVAPGDVVKPGETLMVLSRPRVTASS